MPAIGPYSRPHNLMKVDGRTMEARLIRETREALIAHVGGAPSATQRMLIERAVSLTLRIALFDRKLARTGDVSETDAKNYLGFSNALQRTLRELGLKSAAQTRPSLAAHFAKNYGPREAA